MIEPNIIFEDDDFIVIDKPAGWIVNKSDSSRYVKTVQEWVEGRLKVSEVPQVSKVSEGIKTASDTSGTFDTFDTFLGRGGIVHRLDKETSGILVIAKNEEAFGKLQAQWKAREVKKTYITLVHGIVAPSDGEINAAVGRLPWNRTRFGVLSEGREALTKYRVLSTQYLEDKKEKEPLSLVEVYPQTGRTHQIRVHMKHIGHPVFADEIYAGRKVARNDRKHIFRHFLHASKITFKHPSSGAIMVFESELPKELSDFFDKLVKE